MASSSRNGVFVSRANFSSDLYKVLLTLKSLHGSRVGANGSTLEDIALHMIKHFCLDGDIKSQVLSALKYGIKMHFIQKKKDKFTLVLPASSIHLAPCKYKNQEMERIRCIFPSHWLSNACGDVCSVAGGSCCGRRRSTGHKTCCQESDESDERGGSCHTCSMKRTQSTCGSCSKKRKLSVCDSCPRKRHKTTCEPSSCSEEESCSQDSCPSCHGRPKKNRARCSLSRASTCNRNRCGSKAKSLYSQMCGAPPEECCNPPANHKAYKNCSCCYK